MGHLLRQGEVDVVRFLLGHGELEGAGLDLIEQHIARPAETGGGAQIPEARGGGFDLLEDLDVVAPRDCGQQFLNKLFKKFSSSMNCR